MKKFIRWMLRNNKFSAELVRKLSMLPLPQKIVHKLIYVYLQSEAERPKLSQAISYYLKKVALPNSKNEVTLSKSAIIKAPALNEKGIILVGFEHELDGLIAHHCIAEIKEKYDVLFMPTWQPFYSFSLLRALKILGKSLVLLPSSESCYYKALALPEYFRTLPFHASSWVNDTLYKTADKNIDILMVANFSIYKRHKLLFEALVHLPKQLKVVLIGRPLENRTMADILAEAKSYGVEDRFEVIEAPSNEIVVDHLCRAKLVLGLSGREGSYVSLAEALFANAAVAVFANAHIGTKNYINPKTGFLLQSDLSLATQILQCLDVVDTLAPREWAVKNISADVNFKRLNMLLAAEAKKMSGSWINNCDAFHIQSFEVAPTAGMWSEEIIKETFSLQQKGLILRTQLQALH
jgi:glycosyltransferase involved in cell wall biosynthesis